MIHTYSNSYSVEHFLQFLGKGVSASYLAGLNIEEVDVRSMIGVLIGSNESGWW